MKIEVRFKDEWRIYHVIKSAVEEAIRPILDTIPDFEKPTLETKFDFPTTFIPKEGEINPSQETFDLNSLSNSDIKFNPAIDRAKSYASQLAFCLSHFISQVLEIFGKCIQNILYHRLLVD